MNCTVSTSCRAKRTILLVLVFLLGGLVAGIPSGYSAANDNPLKEFGGEFTLQSADGPVSLSDFRGKVILIYFGYTSCPDACPTTLARIAAVMRQLDEKESEQLHTLFVSFDPARDSYEDLKAYVQYFHPQITGVTGPAEKVKEIADRYGAVYMEVLMQNSAMEYVFDHSSITAVVNKSGEMEELIYPEDTMDEMLAKIRKLL